MLEEYVYQLYSHKKPKEEFPTYSLRFTARTIGEFKNQLFALHYASDARRMNLTERDLEIVHSDRIMED